MSSSICLSIYLSIYEKAQIIKPRSEETEENVIFKVFHNF